MVASELRIGNLLYFAATKDISRVELIHKNHFDCRDEYGSFIPNGNYEPIPLSEEILLKCGFDKEVQDYNGFSVIIFRLKGWLPFLKEMKLQEAKWYQVYHVADCHISELHQLQNLYFALTGQELNVEL